MQQLQNFPLREEWPYFFSLLEFTNCSFCLAIVKVESVIIIEVALQKNIKPHYDILLHYIVSHYMNRKILSSAVQRLQSITKSFVGDGDLSTS